MSIAVGESSPNPLPVEALYAGEINETYDALKGFVDILTNDDEILPPYLTSSTFHFKDFTPPFPLPREVKLSDDIIEKISVKVDRAAEIMIGADVSLWADTNPEANPIMMYDRTMVDGKNQFVQISPTGKTLDRSHVASSEADDILINLALTRKERVNLALAKSGGVISSLNMLGSLSPLIEAGLENNAEEISKTNEYFFTLKDSDEDKDEHSHEITFIHTESPLSTLFYIKIRSTHIDGGVTRKGISTTTIKKTIDLDKVNASYSVEIAGNVDVIDIDFPGEQTTEAIGQADILLLITSLFNLTTRKARQISTNQIIDELPFNDLS